MKVYLSGAMKNVDSLISGVWRDYCTTMLEEINGYEVFNPAKHYDYDKMKPETERACRKLYMNNLKMCDVVLVNLDFSDASCGTNYELGYANAIGLPIIGFGTTNIYSWAADVCDVALENMGDAVEYIITHY